MKSKTLIGIASCAGFASSAIAGGTFTIADTNTSATFDPASGQVNWLIDGTNQLFTQEFYFRRSTDTREFRMDSSNLNNIGNFTQDTNPFTDTRADAFGSLFSDNNGLEFETLFTIRGNAPGSNSAALAEQITIRNTSNAAISISFFQFVDFDLGGDPFDDFGQIVGGNTAQQSDDNTILSETVATPMPTFFQVGDSFDMTNMFNDSAIDNLDGTASYSGDVAWAFQWDITLQAGGSFLISKNKNIIPTPGSLMILGSAGFFAARRRRS
ncbi:MAG: hypothetical protein JKY43_00670 [Phycisphaerales bacterium]|nr:hypothetical protein [Phycisphaerales bacterium]